MKRLNPEKLHVTYLHGLGPEKLVLPRHYTLTHSDRTGELFLSIGSEYNTKQISNIYTRFMRDEVLAELYNNGDDFILAIHCHVSGGFVLGTAKWRHNILKSELPLVIEALRYGDRALYEQNPELERAGVIVHFHSANSKFDKTEDWNAIENYR
jgi:hypothetical protein